MTAFLSEPRVFRNARSILAESIVADATGIVRWCDISAGLLHESTLGGAVDGSDDTVFALPAPLASFHPASVDGRDGFVASLQNRVVVTDARGTIIRNLAEIAHRSDGMRLNEGKVDPAGRWVTGSMDLSGDADGAFYSVTGDGMLRTVVGGVGTGNGLEWSADGSRIYFTDTSVGTIYVGEYSAEGEITDARVFVADGPHDGLVGDEDGGFFTAFYGQGVVAHYDENGTQTGTIELPVPNVTSVALGGPDRSTLFVASARENLTERQLEQHPLSGSVFAVETDARGRLPYRFTSGGLTPDGLASDGLTPDGLTPDGLTSPR